MGRSVSHPTGAIVAFRPLDNGEEDNPDWSCECLVEEIVDTARAVFPAFELFDGWRGRENRILLRNAYADCGISTYSEWQRSGSPSVTIAATGKPVTDGQDQVGHSNGLVRYPTNSITCSASCAWSVVFPVAKLSLRAEHLVTAQPQSIVP